MFTIRKPLAISLCAVALALSCNKIQNDNPKGPDSEDPQEQQLDSAALQFWKTEYAGTGFESADSIARGVYMRDGKACEWNKTLRSASTDNRYEFYNRSGQLRYVCHSEGYALTLPRASELTLDYTGAKYGMYFDWGDARLRVTLEPVRPNWYSIETYKGEWMDRYLRNNSYITSNDLRYFSNTVKENTTLLPGYKVDIYSIQIKNPGCIDLPFYKIAIIVNEKSKKIGLLVYKSAEPKSEEFLAILKSFTMVGSFGKAKNYYPAATPTPDPSWNDETKAYYNKLLTQKKFDFGVFSGTFPCDDDDQATYINTFNKIKAEKNRLESTFGCTYGIMPTYEGMSWFGDIYYFPVKAATDFAGGNGFNGKPVLQMSYQFTNNNNSVSVWNTESNPTPMFDILRGKYDSYFKKYAADIKAYGKPMFFRLNNEMNTDWTSYCGMMTLLDPELFIATWKYLYNIFKAEGVDNCIWVFNPVAVTCPYSNWGEDMAYYPGDDYVHCLGLTNYEMGNSVPFESFRDKYSAIYQENSALFGSIPWIIGEFACGCGGNSDGSVLKRNKKYQAKWVEDMFKEFANYDSNEYLHPIKGIIWFSCNDYSESLIVNQLSLDSDLTETLDAFKAGFAEFNKQ